MSTDTKSRLPLVIVAGGALLATVMAGLVKLPASVESIMNEARRSVKWDMNDRNAREVCFDVRNYPRHLVRITWALPQRGNSFKEQVKRWYECEPAEPDQVVTLRVRPFEENGERVCIIWSQGEVLDNDSASGMRDCFVSALVP